MVSDSAEMGSGSRHEDRTVGSDGRDGQSLG